MEIAADGVPLDPARVAMHLRDYVSFASVCQAAPLDQAKFTIEGDPYPGWAPQSDGPALQTLALIAAFPKLDQATQRTAVAIADQNTDHLLSVYPDATTSLWEEVAGHSFFARAVQRRCLQALQRQPFGMAVPGGVPDAIAALTEALTGHWDGSHYLTFSPMVDTGVHGVYDPNSDIVCAAVYGDLDCTDPKLLATAAKIRGQWSDEGDAYHYPINDADRRLGFGPVIGRYPGDRYDGDGTNPTVGHPWVLCTCNFAELYYRLARAIAAGAPVPADPVAGPFLAQVGIDAGAPASAAVTALKTAGDRMLWAIVYHSDNLELSEQLDRDTGYEKSVSNLTWSYAAYLSAVRARSAV
jgi:glucoamylase